MRPLEIGLQTLRRVVSIEIAASFAILRRPWQSPPTQLNVVSGVFKAPQSHHGRRAVAPSSPPATTT
jgi:hypothetical protein